MKKKLLSMLLALCMVVTLFPASALAADLTTNETTGATEATYTASGSETSGSLADAFQNADTGTTITLNSDAAISKTLFVAGKTLTFNLNGHTVSVANGSTIWGTSYAMISLLNKANLTIQNNAAAGGIIAAENDSYVIDVWQESTCTINATDTTQFIGNLHTVYVHTGTATINGGRFDLKQLDEQKPYAFELNCLDANAANGTAKIIVNSGVFVGMNPSDTKGDLQDPTNYVAESSKVTSAQGTTWDNKSVTVYTVAKDQPTPPEEDPTLTFNAIPENITTLYEKNVSDLGKFEIAQNETAITVTGSANYISDYTNFSSDQKEQAGHYLPIQIKAPENTAITIKGSSEKDLTFGNGGSFELVMYLDAMAAAQSPKTAFTVTVGETVYTVDFSGVTLAPKPADEQTKVEVKPGEDPDGPGTVEVSKGDVVVSIPDDVETTDADQNTTGLGSMAVVVDTVADNDKASINTANETPAAVSDAIKGSSSTVVEIAIHTVNENGEVQENDKLFTANDALTDNPITVTIKVTGTGLHHIFCIKDDGTVTYYGSAMPTEGKIPFTTGHLCHFVAVPEPTDATEKAALTAAISTMTKDSGSNLHPSEPEPTKITATYNAYAKTDSEYATWGSGKLTLKNLEENNFYTVQLSSNNTNYAVYQVVKAGASGEIALRVQPGLNLMLFKIGADESKFAESMGKGPVLGFNNERLTDGATITQQ